jgi:hypothetical protein
MLNTAHGDIFFNLLICLREERRLRVFENRMLRIFGPKRDEVTMSEETAQ